MPGSTTTCAKTLQYRSTRTTSGGQLHGALAVLVIVIVAVPAAGRVDSAWAVPPGLTVEFDGNGKDKVIFATGVRTKNANLAAFYETLK
jgi:hypothetical protein